MKKVVLENCVFMNGGDAAIGLSIIEALRRAFGDDVQVTVVDSHAGSIDSYYPELRFVRSLVDIHRHSLSMRLRKLLFRMKKTDVADKLVELIGSAAAACASQGGKSRSEARQVLDAYCDSDLIVSTGGTYLVEHYNLIWRIAELEKSLLFGVPVVMFTQSMGPFANARNRARLSRFLRQARLILLRDQKSVESVRDLDPALVSKTRLSPDIAFLYAARLADRPRQPAVAGRVRKVCISVRSWNHFAGRSAADGMQAYGAAIRDLVTYLVRQQKADVTFLSTCQGIGEYWTDDSRVAEEICALLDADVRKSVVVDRNFYQPQALVDRLAAFDLTVSTRMHLAILSLCAGTPVLPLAYEFKTEELFERFGMKDRVCWIDRLDGVELPEVAARFIGELDQIAAQQRAATLNEYDRCLETIDSLRSLLSPSA